MRPTLNQIVLKSLTLIIVTLSVVCCMVCSLLTLSIQKSKYAMHWMLCLLRLLIQYTGVCGSYTKTVYRVLWGVKTLLCIKWPFKAFQGGRLFEKPSVLWVWLFTSQSEEAALLSFWDLSTTRVIAGKTHSQSPILRTKGVLSNPVILTYLQSCILYTLTKLPT